MVNVAIIGTEKSGRTSLAANLGKKGTVSDITMYNNAKEGKNMVFVDANSYPKTLKSLVTVLNISDIAVLCIPPQGLDAHTGECIIALDLLGFKHGIIALTKSDSTNMHAVDEFKAKLKVITAGTALQNWECISLNTNKSAKNPFEGVDDLKAIINEMAEKIEVEHAELNSLPARIFIDHAFNVMGKGCVVLGVVKQGISKEKDKTKIFPLDREIEIKSIQSHDVDITEAPTGTRVGMRLKNVQAKDIERGFIISDKENVTTDYVLECAISKFTKKIEPESVLHLFVGLQSEPVRVEKILVDGKEAKEAKPGTTCVLELSGNKKVAYSKEDRFLLSNLDLTQRFAAYGFSK
ncbi:elongation factor Tu [Methanosarcina sp. 1.H.T.1A.1]|uniref:elongation factor Tu n=1 Tax=Methanosarcina sp. 1.H.T.1A.1 TaxID=1483602 RepID=UPI00062257B6|nr:elongation factor Tu [Methanosarcina sp. 1.H.T.1A.1]KKH99334.1 elongation factor Tu [Methanosarcina sp. 1.H.T.1A.1]